MVEGILSEVMRQIDLVMPEINKLLVLEAKANLKNTWEDLFSLADIQDKDKELDKEFDDPNHPVTTLCLYICQIQSFVLQEINLAIQSKDQAILKTLGPFDFALSCIIGYAQS